MACVSGTNIVNDGLVFHFDLENTVKSWKDKPTSNLAANAIWYDTASSFIQYNVIEGPFDGTTANLFSDNAASGEITYRISSGTGVLTNALNCNFSIYLKKYTSRYGHIGIGNGCFGGQAALTIDFNTGTIVSNGGLNNAYVENVGNGWYRLSGYRTTNTSLYNTGGFFMWLVNENTYTPGAYVPGSCVFTGNGQGFYFALPQFETNTTFASRYVNGIRLDTASIIDVSPKRNIVTALNLTYRQDATPTFDGTDDRLSLGYIPELLTTEKTNEAWVKASNFVNWHGIISNMPSWGTGFSLQIGSIQNIAAMISGDYLTTSWAPSTNVWYHIVATHDINNLNVLYVNGVQEATTVRAVTYVENAVTEIGVFYTAPSLYFGGEISQVKIYNRALTAAEVKQNFESNRSRYNI